MLCRVRFKCNLTCHIVQGFSQGSTGPKFKVLMLLHLPTMLSYSSLLCITAIKGQTAQYNSRSKNAKRKGYIPKDIEETIGKFVLLVIRFARVYKHCKRITSLLLVLASTENHFLQPSTSPLFQLLIYRTELKKKHSNPIFCCNHAVQLRKNRLMNKLSFKM